METITELTCLLSIENSSDNCTCNGLCDFSFFILFSYRLLHKLLVVHSDNAKLIFSHNKIGLAGFDFIYIRNIYIFYECIIETGQIHLLYTEDSNAHSLFIYIYFFTNF